jgi:hypothetical protein
MSPYYCYRYGFLFGFNNHGRVIDIEISTLKRFSMFVTLRGQVLKQGEANNVFG